MIDINIWKWNSKNNVEKAKSVQGICSNRSCCSYITKDAVCQQHICLSVMEISLVCNRAGCTSVVQLVRQPLYGLSLPKKWNIFNVTNKILIILCSLDVNIKKINILKESNIEKNTIIIKHTMKRETDIGLINQVVKN